MILGAGAGYNDIIGESIRLHRKRHGDNTYERLAQQLIEEMAELTQAMSKRLRFREEARHELMLRQGKTYEEACRIVNANRQTSHYEIFAEATDVLICLIHMQEHEGWQDDDLRAHLVERATKVSRACAMEMTT